MSMHSCRNLLFAAIAVVALPQRLHAQAGGEPSAAERAAVFKAAGAVQKGGQWRLCPEDPHGGAASLEQYRDLNGDGYKDALVTDGGTYCYGSTEAGYVLLAGQAGGGWKTLDAGGGIVEFQSGKGKDGWPDILLGGPGFCFPVLRWNGREYAVNRHEYEGKACRPSQ
ncbi:MAG: hypothetical protein QM719_03090 [Thermomonas sp.]